MPASTAKTRTLAVRPTTAEVRSQTDPETRYPVELATCPCPDMHWRNGKPMCKHIIATYAELFGVQITITPL